MNSFLERSRHRIFEVIQKDIKFCLPYAKPLEVKRPVVNRPGVKLLIPERRLRGKSSSIDGNSHCGIVGVVERAVIIHSYNYQDLEMNYIEIDNIPGTKP